ncbi:MAG TPA: hypothetical protein VFB52_02695 [Solirubrobacterales bacterium]|nr:hypothetical protein [Solirubrobacterales bacterium]
MRVPGGITVLVAIALIAASPASAATEAGDGCTANVAEGPYSLVPEAQASPSPLPLATPVGGVVTRWKVNSTYMEPVPERLGVFRPTGTAGRFLVVGESNEELVPVGGGSFATRIPVQAGDRFGPIAVINDTLYCLTGNAADKAWAFNGSAGTGSTHTFAAGIEVRVPMVVTVEPDGDGDGYGDESQDGCPQSALTHLACPTVSLATFAVVKPNAVLLLVSTSSTAPVAVTGSVKAGKGKPLALSAAKQTVSPGGLARFKLAFPKRLSGALAELESSKSLKLKVKATATDVAGRAAVSASTVKLRGRG